MIEIAEVRKFFGERRCSSESRFGLRCHALDANKGNAQPALQEHLVARTSVDAKLRERPGAPIATLGQ